MKDAKKKTVNRRTVFFHQPSNIQKGGIGLFRSAKIIFRLCKEGGAKNARWTPPGNAGLRFFERSPPLGVYALKTKFSVRMHGIFNSEPVTMVFRPCIPQIQADFNHLGPQQGLPLDLLSGIWLDQAIGGGATGRRPPRAPCSWGTRKKSWLHTKGGQNEQSF